MIFFRFFLEIFFNFLLSLHLKTINGRNVKFTFRAKTHLKSDYPFLYTGPGTQVYDILAGIANAAWGKGNVSPEIKHFKGVRVQIYEFPGGSVKGPTPN